VPGGIAFIVIGLQGFAENGGLSVLAILLGALTAVVGGLFGWIVWTGLVPASFEEYGLDDSSDIEQSSNQARSQRRLEE
jgi:hypothetical protein